MLPGVRGRTSPLSKETGMDIPTITTAFGAIACVIGILTFVSGMVQRAKADGEQIANIKQLVANLSDMREDIKEIRRLCDDFMLVNETQNGRMKLIERELDFFREQMKQLGGDHNVQK